MEIGFNLNAPGLVLKIALNVTKEEIFFPPWFTYLSEQCYFNLLKEAGLRQDKWPIWQRRED